MIIFIKSELTFLGQGQLLGSLKDSISQANENIFIVGPWLDAYFTRIVINSIIDNKIRVKFVVRQDDGVIDKKTLSALNLANQNLENFQAKSLENLHSKMILIDNETFFLGSANWYWYSLNNSIESTIKGTIPQLPELIHVLKNYWKRGYPIDIDLSNYTDFEPKSRDLEYL